MNQSKTIVCCLPSGRGEKVMNQLEQDLGLTTSITYHCRAYGLLAAHKPDIVINGPSAEIEQDLLTVFVDSTQADEVFEYLYLEAGISEPNGGFIYQAAVVQPVSG